MTRMKELCVCGYLCPLEIDIASKAGVKCVCIYLQVYSKVPTTIKVEHEMCLTISKMPLTVEDTKTVILYSSTASIVMYLWYNITP